MKPSPPVGSAPPHATTNTQVPARRDIDRILDAIDDNMMIPENARQDGPARSGGVLRRPTYSKETGLTGQPARAAEHGGLKLRDGVSWSIGARLLGEEVSTVRSPCHV
jgi:hypothetical protein